MLWFAQVAGVLSLLGCAVMAHASEPAASALSGAKFQSTETQRLEADEAINPGMLWVERGERLWAGTPAPEKASCASCHGMAEQSMRGVAARFPRFDRKRQNLVNLEGQINHCRSERQGLPAYLPESDELLSLTAFVTRQSRGVQRSMVIDGEAATFLERGQALWRERQGQLNLACTQCHDDLVGQKLRGDTISQGQSDGWPAYRIEWQSLGSLHRRLRACSIGVRAEVLAYGSPEYLALEFYLAWRGRDLPLSSPGVRR